MTASLMILILDDLVKKKYTMFGSHLIDNIKNKQYTNLKVAVLLQPLKDSTPHSRYFSDELGVQTDHVFTCAK